MLPAIARILLISPTLLLLGCQAPPKPTEPTRTIVRLSDRDEALDTIMTVLREHDIPPRTLRRASGELVAGPTTSAQWFEPWRKDAPGLYQLAESSLHTIQREVQVTLKPVEPPDSTTRPTTLPYVLGVQVDKYRYSAPERQITTAAGGLAIYSERLPTTEGLRQSRAAGEHWIHLGRDGLLEDYFLKRFVRRLDLAGPPTASATQ